MKRKKNLKFVKEKGEDRETTGKIEEGRIKIVFYLSEREKRGIIKIVRVGVNKE